MICTSRRSHRGRATSKGGTGNLYLTGKVVVVTGASKGIGLAVTRALIDEGTLVVAGARTTESIDGLDRVTTVPRKPAM
jgi:NADP-dependent 3-hydroxy acid dehydrogenase YdfG